jgi:PPOX class probable FMN-dependent enzyme
MTHTITTEDQLASLFDVVGAASHLKEAESLHPVYQQWINSSPFAVLATVGPGGLDVSPRGDPIPLVRIVNDKTILLPERRGNNRVDGLRNILSDARVALIFFVPGVRETVRVNGKAVITTEPKLLHSFAVDGTLPKCVLEITVDSVFFQCGRALLRSGLWGSGASPKSSDVPTAGMMLSALTSASIDGAAYDRELPARQRDSLY